MIITNFAKQPYNLTALKNKNGIHLLVIFLILSVNLSAQSTPHFTQYKTVVPDSTLQKRSAGFQRQWGTNRRVEWATPVTAPVLWLDSAYGGLTPYEAGGGNESKSLRLRNKAGKEYTLRSINKSRADVIPPGFEKTFVEYIIKDQVSSSHPYAALAVSHMQNIAGIYHGIPTLVYVPAQAALDSFSNKYGNGLYLLEQRGDGDWSDAPNLGNSNDFNSTDKVITRLLEDNRYRADQFAFAKARLFDMFIGDWDRHEDNWRWGKKDSAGDCFYVPIARDRDQAFYVHNGKLVDKLLPAGGFSYMQHFDNKVGNMVTFNKEERDLDPFFTNQLTLDDWKAAAGELMTSLTDEVIGQSIKGLPPEIEAVSGKELRDKLIERRAQLNDIAISYYAYIAKHIDVTGTEKREYFEVNTDVTGNMVVSVYRINEKGEKESQPFYQRAFRPTETTEVRIFGIGGKDVFKIDEHAPGIELHVIGGKDEDEYIQTGNAMAIYDDKSNIFKTQSAHRHLKRDRFINTWHYQNFDETSKGISPIVSFNYEDRIHAGLLYSWKRHTWHRDMLSHQHSIGANYSISQNALSGYYGGVFPQRIGHWDIFLYGVYDAVRWTNFFGLGNETTADTKRVSFYRMITTEWTIAAGLRRLVGNGVLEISPFFQRVNMKRSTGKFVTNVSPSLNTNQFDPYNYMGLRVSYRHIHVNNPVVPTRGFVFAGTVNRATNSQKELMQTVQLKAQAFIPLGNKFSISCKAGGTVVANSSANNTAQLYEHAVIGGPESLRGYRLERFWGKQSYYNNNELRFITNIRTFILNAKAGVLAFFDDGRVWYSPDNSKKIHTSYGGGVMLAPFQKISFTLTYGVSPEMRLVQFRLNTLL